MSGLWSNSAVVHQNFDELQNFKLLAVALAIGLLIGLERGWTLRDKAEGTRVAGLRTYGLLSLLGGLWALLAQQTGQSLMGFAFVSVTLVLLVAYRGSLKKFENYSITGTIASLATFSLGALTVFGHVSLAAATAVVMTSLLGYKPLLHGWINRLEQAEIYATLKLLLISVVILPVLPDREMGPWHALNPYHIWLMVVLIAAISYLGYFAIKIVGNRHGPMLTGIFGGLASSTAVTLDLSRLAKENPPMQNTLAAGILTACATMYFRILLVTSILNAALFHDLLPALVSMGCVNYLLAFLLWHNAKEFQPEQGISLQNPFQLGIAIKFGMLLLLVMLLSKVLQAYFGAIGTYFLAAVSGISDVDAITLSVANMNETEIDRVVAGFAILLAACSNTLFKCGLSWVVGGRSLASKVGGASLLAVAAGFAVILLKA
jgi:uncharacterized membrane protein (DUF4010 family)